MIEDGHPPEGTDFEELRSSNQHLRLLVSFQQQFLAALTHDLQTPPVIIMGNSELLLRKKYGPITEAQEKALRAIHRNVTLLSEMMDQLLSFARLLSERPAVSSAPIALNDTLDRALADIQTECERLHVRISIRRDGGDPEIASDAATLEYLLKNILANAAQFVPTGFEVRGTADAADGRWTLRILATPLRANLPAPSRLIQKFFVTPARGEEKQEVRTPIGLAAGSYLARLLAGDLALEPLEGEGLEIRLVLPTTSSDGAKGRLQSPPKRAERARSARTPREMVANRRFPIRK